MNDLMYSAYYYVVAVVVVIELYYLVLALIRLRQLKSIFPRNSVYSLESDSAKDALQESYDPSQPPSKYVVIKRIHREEEKRKISKRYKMIEDDINAHISAHRNEFIDREQFREIIEIHCKASEEAVQSVIHAPLYIGLLFTLLAVIGYIACILQGFILIEQLWERSEQLVIMYLLYPLALGLTISVLIKLLKEKPLSEYSAGSRELNLVLAKISGSSAANTRVILSQFTETIEEFNESLSRNIFLYNEQYALVNTNLSLQAKVLEQLDKLDFPKQQQLLLELCDAFEDYAEDFVKFDEYLKNIITFIEQSKEILAMSKVIFDRVEKYGSGAEAILEEVNKRLEQSSALIEFLNSNFTAVAVAKQATNDVVISLEKGLRESVNILKQFQQDSTVKIADMMIAHEKEINTLDEKLKTNMPDINKEITSSEESAMTAVLAEIVNKISKYNSDCKIKYNESESDNDNNIVTSDEFDFLQWLTEKHKK